MKKRLMGVLCLLVGVAQGMACTGISFSAKDGGYVQARTIEWGGQLSSERVRDYSQRAEPGIIYSDRCEWSELPG